MSGVDWREPFNSLHLDNHGLLNDQIRTVLSDQFTFDLQCLLVDRIEQSRTLLAMDLDRAAQDLVGNLCVPIKHDK